MARTALNAKVRQLTGFRFQLGKLGPNRLVDENNLIKFVRVVRF